MSTIAKSAAHPGAIRPRHAPSPTDADSLVMIVQAGIDAGVFATVDPEAACTRILLAVDGSGSYANSAGALDDPVHARFVADVAEWTLGLVPGSLD